MHTFILRNRDDVPVELQFSDGSNVTVMARGSYIWTSPEEITLNGITDLESLENIAIEEIVAETLEDTFDDPLFWKTQGF